MTEDQFIRVQREQEFRDLPLPVYATKQSAGFDLHAAIRADITLNPGQWRLISTGIRVAIPEGFEGQIRPRSGLALKYGVTLLNSPGTVDADYRGIVGIILVNLGEEPFCIHRGDRIAQMVVSPIQQMAFQEVDTLKSTTRGSAGFGSTGISFKSLRKDKKIESETSPTFNDEYSRENDITLSGGTEGSEN